jgi:DNA polymerase
MKSLLQDLRTMLEYERAVYGALVPLSDDGALRHRDPVPPEPIDSSDMSGTNLFGRTTDRASDVPRSAYERVHALIPPDSPLIGMTTLAEVEAYVRDTVLIPLDETRINPVFGVGNPDADLLVIGEAPGADEDQKGEPFVGRAGQLLNKILESVDFRREEVYIANILKSRPPKNRDPLPAEVEAHVPILYKQIALIQPKVVLCVGKTSGTTLLNMQTTLGALRQKFHDFHGLPVLVTYHPAALLRNRQWKRPTWEDVQLLRRRFDELVSASKAA